MQAHVFRYWRTMPYTSKRHAEEALRKEYLNDRELYNDLKQLGPEDADIIHLFRENLRLTIKALLMVREP